MVSQAGTNGVQGRGKKKGKATKEENRGGGTRGPGEKNKNTQLQVGEAGKVMKKLKAKTPLRTEMESQGKKPLRIEGQKENLRLRGEKLKGRSGREIKYGSGLHPG